MWDKSVFETFEAKKKAYMAGGGASRVEKQHAKGKLTARERVALLFDGGEYEEFDTMIETRCMDFDMDKKKVPGDGVVAAYGLVNGRYVCASAQDFTVHGGAGGEEHVLKICKLLQKAMDMRVPFVNINDGGGARIEEGVSSLSAFSHLFLVNTMASGLIPQISVIMGPCAGGSSYSPAICDYIFMVENTSQMYLTGPQVIKTVTGENVSAESLGGASVHMQKSGVAHFSYPDDKSCLEAVRKLLSYLPESCEDTPPVTPGIPMDLCKGLPEVVSDKQRLCYDVHAVIGAVADKHSFIEVQREFAKNIVVGFGKLDGQTVGFVANQPKYKGGSLDADAADKGARFVRFCDCFNIPLISFVDAPAFLPGTEQEYMGVIRHGAKLPYAFCEATVPKICLILRKSYGGAFGAMNSKFMSADIVYAWPIAQVAAMGGAGAVNIIFNKQIAASDDPEAERKKLLDEYEAKFMNPYFAASRGYVDEVILPEDTRKKLVAALGLLRSKKEDRPKKKHGNIPL